MGRNLVIVLGALLLYGLLVVQRGWSPERYGSWIARALLAERRILTIGDSLFAGYGLSPGQGYPPRLEAALRARGINARIANAGADLARAPLDLAPVAGLDLHPFGKSPLQPAQRGGIGVAGSGANAPASPHQVPIRA